MEQIFFFEVGVFKQGDVLKHTFQKGYKISFRMYLNLCNAKFSMIDVENRVYWEAILSLHFSIAFFNMCVAIAMFHMAAVSFACVCTC